MATICINSELNKDDFLIRAAKLTPNIYAAQDLNSCNNLYK